MTPHPHLHIHRDGGPAGPSRISGADVRGWARRAGNRIRKGLRFPGEGARRVNDFKSLGCDFGPDGRDGLENIACSRARNSEGSGGFTVYAKGKFSSPICPSSPNKPSNLLKTNNRRKEKTRKYSSPYSKFQAHQAQQQTPKINR